MEDWSDWKPDFKPKSKQTPKNPHLLQEAHSPSESITFRGGEKLEARRRVTDARLWDAMTPTQQDAALQIAKAYETMSRGMGYITSDWTRIPGGGGAGNIGDLHARLVRGYVEWTVLCAKNNISHSLVIDVLVFGFSCRALDRDRRQGQGLTRANLMEGLWLYADMKGWPRD